ncbi:hypothetical protein [Oligoflexus tunisiensis]|uniref:hypothetical protein n=1 Tax=Oligoflexus tunisiensis TaxID=708132 RepID=UPI00114CD8B7|nr:hypothetical protein [Oligoflexus tunisiensis]
MVPANNLSKLQEYLGEQTATKNRLGQDQNFFLVGLLFAPPQEQISKSEIVPMLDQYHHSSGTHAYFLCAGYSAYDPEAEPVATVNNEPWGFSAKNFASFVDEVEKLTKWRYGGGSELLLFDSFSDGKTFRLYTKTALCLDLNAILKDGSFDTISGLFHHIFNFKKDRGHAVCSDLSDNLGLLMGKDYFLSQLGALWKTAKHFAVRDITKDAQVNVIRGRRKGKAS